MNIKHTFVALTSLAAVGVMASLVQAQAYPIQQGRYQVQPGQYQVQQGRFIQGNVVQGNQSQGQAKQSPTYTNLNMTDEQRAKSSIGATLVNAGTAVGVRSVFTNSPAQQAGLTSGDIITQINGKPANGAGPFTAMIEGMKPGDTIKVTKQNRQGKKSEAEITLMTMGEIIEASITPEAGAYDGVVRQTEIGIKGLEQKIKNTEDELDDMKKRLAAQEKMLTEMKAKAEQAAKDAARLKQENDAKRAAQMEKLKQERAAAAEAAADAEVQRQSN